MRRLAWFSLCFAGGLVAALQWLPEGLTLIGGLFCLTAALLLPVVVPSVGLPIRWCGTGLALGGLWALLWMNLVCLPAQSCLPANGTFSGVIVGQVEQTTYGYAFSARLTVEGQSFSTLCYVSDQTDANGTLLSPGATFQCEANCTEASDSQRSQSYQVVAKCKTLSVTGQAPHQWRYLSAKWAGRLKAVLTDLYPDENEGIFLALLTGDQSGISSAVHTVFRRTGLQYLLAVSGMHLNLLLSFFLLLLPNRRQQLMLFPLLLAFACMVDTPACWRALVMLGFFLLAPLFDRAADGLTSLGGALVALLLHNPYTILNVGFQLSFASMVGILLLDRPLLRWLNRQFDRERRSGIHRALFLLGNQLVRSLCALSCSLPLVAIHFGSISLVEPVTTLLISWTLPILFVGGGLSAVVFLLSPTAGTWLALIPSLLCKWVIGCATLFSRLSFSSLQLDNVYTIIWFVTLYLVAALLFLSPTLRKRWPLPVSGVGLLLVAVLCLQQFSIQRNDLTVKVLDVGQGQCILFLSKDSAVAVDCGGNGYDSAGDLLADQLQALGRSQLDLLILTHADSDHTNGLEELYQRISVSAVALSDVDWTDEGESDAILSLAEEYGSVVHYITSTQTIDFGNATVTIYPPVRQESGNNASLSVFCTCGDFSLLTTGDMDSQSEAILLAREDLEPVDVLIVGHHGSKYATSEALLEALSPQVAVISVGSNRYGHPSEETLERLSDAQTTIYRTDENGTLTFCVKN